MLCELVEDAAEMVRIKHTAKKGRAVFALRDYAVGTLVFSEEPLACTQLLDNISLVKCCARCIRPIGTVVSQLEHSSCGKISALPVSQQDSYLSEVVPCTCTKGNGCKRQYCSVKCANAHAEKGHQLLCPLEVDTLPFYFNTGGNESAIEPGTTSSLKCDLTSHSRFARHARKQHEGLFMAAEIVATICATFEKNGGIIEAALAPFAAVCKEPWHKIVSPIFLPFSSLH